MFHYDACALHKAEVTLEKLSEQMAAQFQRDGSTWPHDQMQHHATQRGAVLQVRNLLTKLIEERHDRMDAIYKEHRSSHPIFRPRL